MCYIKLICSKRSYFIRFYYYSILFNFEYKEFVKLSCKRCSIELNLQTISMLINFDIFFVIYRFFHEKSIKCISLSKYIIFSYLSKFFFFLFTIDILSSLMYLSNVLIDICNISFEWSSNKSKNSLFSSIIKSIICFSWSCINKFNQLQKIDEMKKSIEKWYDDYAKIQWRVISW